MTMYQANQINHPFRKVYLLDQDPLLDVEGVITTQMAISSTQV